jgi:hypothetical protein
VDDEEQGVVPLPQGSVVVNGNVRTVTEYYRNDKGEAMKKVVKYKVVNVEKKVYKVGATLVQAASALQAPQGQAPASMLLRRPCTPRSRAVGLPKYSLQCFCAGLPAECPGAPCMGSLWRGSQGRSRG